MNAGPSYIMGPMELAICLGVPILLAVVTAIVVAVAISSQRPRKDQ